MLEKHLESLSWWEGNLGLILWVDEEKMSWFSGWDQTTSHNCSIFPYDLMKRSCYIHDRFEIGHLARFKMTVIPEFKYEIAIKQHLKFPSS